MGVKSRSQLNAKLDAADGLNIALATARVRSMRYKVDALYDGDEDANPQAHCKDLRPGDHDAAGELF
jgi:hypothetical protein